HGSSNGFRRHATPPGASDSSRWRRWLPPWCARWRHRPLRAIGASSTCRRSGTSTRVDLPHRSGLRTPDRKTVVERRGGTLLDHGLAARPLALVFLQVALADADRLRRDLGEFVVGDELDRVLERQL